MKTLNRYFLLFLSGITFYILYRASLQHAPNPCHSADSSPANIQLVEYLTKRKSIYTVEMFQNVRQFVPEASRNVTRRRCHLDTCFDFSRCKQSSQSVKIYVYPNDGQNASPTFMKIINFIKESKYYEPDPNKGKCRTFSRSFFFSVIDSFLTFHSFSF